MKFDIWCSRINLLQEGPGNENDAKATAWYRRKIISGMFPQLPC